MTYEETQLKLYQKLYATVFAKADEALTELEKATEQRDAPDLSGICRAKIILTEALQNAEELYLSAEEEIHEKE